MKSPICVSNLCVTNRKHTASFSIVGLMLAIAPLWLMLVAANTSAQVQTTESSADWTEFHRDNMQRWNPYETVLNVNNVGSLQLKWEKPTGGKYNYFGLNSAPAVVNGVVYIGSPTGTYGGGSPNYSFYALDASTGATLWSFNTGSPVQSSPAVANGVVYFGSGDDNVYALNASTGAKLWSYTTGGGIDSSPAVVNGVVYFGSEDDNVYALNASTGAKLWSFTTGSGIGSSPAVANGVVYVGSSDGNVYALNASTGAKLWSYDTNALNGGPVISSPAVVNGVVYVSSGFNSNGIVYALNAGTGALLWSYATGGEVWSSPSVVNGMVYIGTYAGSVIALNASTGALLWSFGTSEFWQSSPAVANGVVYVGSGVLSCCAVLGPGLCPGNIYALNASTGALLWSYTLGVWNSSPAIVDGVLYISGGDFPPYQPPNPNQFPYNPYLPPPGTCQQGNDFSGTGNIYAFSLPSAASADLFLRIQPTPETVHQGDLLTYAFPVWNLGPGDAVHEVLNTQVPEGTSLDYVRISGTPGLGTCTTPPYEGTGEIVCHENSAMAPNTTWTVRVVVKVTAPAGTVITESATTTEKTPDPNLANNTATVSLTVQ
jgi:outer membrane protein assembly factor BamB